MPGHGKRGYIERAAPNWFVGARREATKEYPEGYLGPCAQISFDNTWLHIITDSYGGHAMLNIEALPYLQKALAEIARQIRQKRIK